MKICELKFPQMELLLRIPPESNTKIASSCQAMQAVGGGEVDRECLIKFYHIDHAMIDLIILLLLDI